ncbi:MAG: hypothetical protein JWP27_2712 [Flaviaesturariibacter sp.]|nr:hypothetical protein [Flaviaesturariibacter sp.]
MATNYNPAYKEGKVAAAIEKQTAKIPSDVYLWTAVACMAVSATLQIMGKRKTSLFIGQWPAPFLIMGLYNKLVKLEGTDGNNQNP